MRVLWVTAELPDRDLGGGNIRQYHLLSAVAEAHDTDLLVAGRLRSPELRARVRQVTEVDPAAPYSWPEGRWARRLAEVTVGLPERAPFEVVIEAATRRRLAERLPVSGYDVVIVVHAAMAPLVPDRGRRSGVWVVELQNLASDRSTQTAAVADHGRHRWLWQRDAGRAARLERWIARTADVVVVCSADDAAAFRGSTLVVPNGVDTTRFVPTPLPAAPRLVLTASFNYPPNVEGAVWFCDEVLPLVREQRPDAVLTLVGRQPHADVRALTGRAGVTAAFDVADVVPYTAAARVAVVPLRVGSGTRLKALEAMASGRPVAGTSIGLAGLGLVDGESAVIADDPGALAAGIVRLLADDAPATSMAATVRALAEAHFGWDAIGARYVAALEDLAAAERSTSA